MSEQFLPEFLNTYICETYEKYPIGFSTELYNILSDNLLNDNFEILLNNLSVILTDDNIKDLICVCLKIKKTLMLINVKLIISIVLN